MKSLLAVCVTVVALAGCGSEEETTAGPVTVTETQPAATPSAPEPTPEPEAEPAPEPAAKKIAIPDVVGENHQDAQDQMQAAGLFMLREKDATGMERLLVLDSNWEVVSQNPAAGKRVSENTTITLSSKKIGE